VRDFATPWLDGERRWGGVCVGVVRGWEDEVDVVGLSEEKNLSASSTSSS